MLNHARHRTKEDKAFAMDAAETIDVFFRPLLDRQRSRDRLRAIAESPGQTRGATCLKIST
jgi:hypothetical protein